MPSKPKEEREEEFVPDSDDEEMEKPRNCRADKLKSKKLDSKIKLRKKQAKSKSHRWSVILQGTHARNPKWARFWIEHDWQLCQNSMGPYS